VVAGSEQKANMALPLKVSLERSLAGRFGDELFNRKNATPEGLATDLGAIDVPRGSLTEFSGPASSGRTSFLHAALARSTRRPEFCALIDAGNSFDPLSARTSGVQLRHLLWLRCGGSAEKALKAADLIVQAGGFGIVALDLTSVPTREARRISLASWFRLRHAIEKTPTALVVIGEEHYTASCSTFQVEGRAAGSEIRDGLFRGVRADATLGPRQRTNTAFSLKPAYRI
jgi:hypothetical protein